MKYATTLFASLALLLVPLWATAQPTIDGSIDGDQDNYVKLGEWTQGDTGFGPHGMLELYATQDGQNPVSPWVHSPSFT
jgi:hypothetical protein